MQKDKEVVISKEGNKDIIEMEGTHHDHDDEKEETLPPGFRFHPTDEELISYYLTNKISDSNFTGKAIGDVDLNKCEPWELPGKAKMGKKEWYFFSQRDRKYPTGVRTNRATNTGYWKTTGKDKEIFNSSNAATSSSELVGLKKTLVFYKGRAPRGEKSNWVMHEYRILPRSTFRTNNKQDEWVVCRVFRKSAGAKKFPTSNNHTRALNIPYNDLEVSCPSINNVPPPNPMMHHLAADPAAAAAQYFHLYGRYMMMSPSDQVAEVTRVFSSSRGGGSSTSSVNNVMNMNVNMNLPIAMQYSHFNNNPVAGEAKGFSISGLNLNLGGAGGTVATTTTQASQPLLRPMMPPSPAHTHTMAQVLHHDFITSNMMTPPNVNALAANNVVGYSTADMSSANSHGNRYMGVDHCMDLDNYWPSSY